MLTNEWSSFPTIPTVARQFPNTFLTSPLDKRKVIDYLSLMTDEFLIKEYGLPLTETKKQVEAVSKVLDDLILKHQIENLSDEDTYKMLDYLILTVTSEISVLDMDIEELKKKYSKIPISYESDIRYQRWNNDKKYSENLLKELKELKDVSEIKKHVISTLLPQVLIQEKELAIYSAKKIMDENLLKANEEGVMSILEKTEEIKSEEASVEVVSENQSNLEQLYEMPSFQEFLKKVEQTKKELKGAKKQLRDLNKTFINNILLLNEQVNLASSIKKNNGGLIAKTDKILLEKFKEDKEKFDLLKESIEIIKDSFREAVTNQLIIIDVVYPVYDIVKTNEIGINTDEQVIEFFVTKLLNDDSFSIKRYIENASQKEKNESSQKIADAKNDIRQTSTEIFSEESKEKTDDIDTIVANAEKIKTSLELSKKENNLPKEELEILKK